MAWRVRLLLAVLVVLLVPSCRAAQPPSHDAFKVAVYIPVEVVVKMKDHAWLEKSWSAIASQVKVDKVYIESYRSGVVADDALLESVKAFFAGQGVETAGGIAYVGTGDSGEGETGQFVSMCYTDPRQRELVKHVAELTARHFDEIILDDFFFNNTKRDSDIAARGGDSWPAFRLKLMDGVARDLVVAPARAVNPRVKIVIKFPNWYEHFQANGYDLAREPKIFDGIYTGTETRDPVITDQHLQQYESYQIVRYFDNVAPGRNGGGWVDTYDTRYLDRYAEQLWDTILARAPEMTLFQYSDLLRPPAVGDRSKWQDAKTSFDLAAMNRWHDNSGSSAPLNYATAAGYALNTVGAVAAKLGTPEGIASYKPYQSTGEDFLHNYLGMIGIPVDLHPEFPAGRDMVLLTASAAADPNLVDKIDAYLKHGGKVVLTSGLLKALEPRGFAQIADLHVTGNVLRVNEYWGALGAGGGASLGATQDVLVPEIAFMTNDAWPVVRGTASGRGAPLLLMEHYAKGVLFVLTIPVNPNDLYALPQPVLTAIRSYLLAGFPVGMDAPARVSLFAYDNGSFVVQSFRDEAARVTVSLAAPAARMRNLATGEVLAGKAAPGKAGRTAFSFDVPPHSFVAFTAE